MAMVTGLVKSITAPLAISVPLMYAVAPSDTVKLVARLVTSVVPATSNAMAIVTDDSDMARLGMANDSSSQAVLGSFLASNL